MTTKQSEIKSLFMDTNPMNGKPYEWEIVKDWTAIDDGDGTGNTEELVVRDKATGEEQRSIRMAPAEEKRLAAIEVVHAEARAALDDAGQDRTAQGILWLAAVKEDPTLKDLEELDEDELRELQAILEEVSETED